MEQIIIRLAMLRSLLQGICLLQIMSLLLMPSKLLASNDSDFQSWNTLTVNKNINDTSKNSDNSGFGENRFYMGFGKKINQYGTLQAGYQDQYIRRFKQNNFNAHMIVISVNANFT